MASSQPPFLAIERDPSEEVLRAFAEWMAGEPSIGKGIPPRNNVGRLGDSVEEGGVSPPRASMSETSHDADRRVVPAQEHVLPRTMPSVTRRVFRTLSLGILVVVIVIVGITRQSGGHDIRAMGSALQASLTSFTALLQGRLDTAPTAVGKSASSAAAKAPILKTVTSQPNSSPPTDKDYAAIRQQIETIANELTRVRGMVEQLAANQAQIDQNIATLSAAEQSINQELLAASTRLSMGRLAPRKRSSMIPQSEAAGKSAPEQVLVPSVGSPLPLR
jgi:hypothetical protein